MNQLPSAGSRKVFVVHGHDDGLKQNVARLLEQLKLEPIILHEKPDQSQTIIQKFEHHSHVGFAVILLTPDDFGYSKEDGPAAARPRARQNVILELGYFRGRLGPERVAALFSGDGTFEAPSDYEGVLYTPVDAGGAWRYKLANELKAASIEVDTNNIV